MIYIFFLASALNVYAFKMKVPASDLIDLKNPALKQRTNECKKNECYEKYEVTAPEFPLAKHLILKKGSFILVNDQSDSDPIIIRANGFKYHDWVFKSATAFSLPHKFKNNWKPAGTALLAEDALIKGRSKDWFLKFKAGTEIIYDDNITKGNYYLTKGTLAEDGNISWSDSFVGRTLSFSIKKDSIIEFHATTGFIPKKLVINQTHTIDNLSIPAHSELYFNNFGALTHISLSEDSELLGSKYTKNTLIPLISNLEYEVVLPRITEKISVEDFENYHCFTGFQWPHKQSALSANCKFTVTKDIAYDGIPLKKGCTVYTSGDPNPKGFDCPFDFEYKGFRFVPHSTVNFSRPMHTYNVEQIPMACSSGTNVSYLNAHFFNGYCVTFSKLREPNMIYAKDNVQIGERIYFGPTLFEVDNQKLTPLIASSTYDKHLVDVPDVNTFEDMYFPLCGKRTPIYLHTDDYLDNTKSEIPACRDISFISSDKNFRDYKRLAIKSSKWKIHAIKGEQDEKELQYYSNGLPYPSFDKSYWLKADDNVTTLIVAQLGELVLPTPFFMYPDMSESDHQRFLFADKNYIYLRAFDSADCWQRGIKYLKTPLPKNFKINNLKPEFKMQYNDKDPNHCGGC